ncbi:DNA-3-methyladenine glycosylase I [Atopobium minutum]|nr:DNA-3-methyladenine glycosylase I [uncultured Atopobium sp.]KRN55437.1 DNA-3-methyladenine glycosylase I [Atopobium minutum]MDU5892812.1 DNA-3-methyladenine glycosylase I [Atopobium minutum]
MDEVDMDKPMYRCGWGNYDEYSRAYHDERWCKPVHDDDELFAMLVLEGMQAGLSWNLILKRETGIREACDGLRPTQVALYDEAKIQELLDNPAMIRSVRKIRAMVENAQAFLRVQKEYGSFDAYIWSFVSGQQIDHQLVSEKDMPASSELSEAVSKDLKKRGFKFVGPVIAYSYIQGIGLINDHVLDCSFR